MLLIQANAYSMMFGKINNDGMNSTTAISQCTGCMCNCRCSCSGSFSMDVEWEEL